MSAAPLRSPDAYPDAIPHWTRVQLSDSAFVTLVRLVEESCGVHLSDLKKTMLETRLRRRLQACDLPDFESYIRFLTSPEGRKSEGQHFVDTVVTNETSFFRERAHFDHLDAAEIARLLANGDGRALRAWSAACSTGQEAYTLAMVLDQASDGAKRWNWSVLATDISVKVLLAAREAVYRAEDAAPVPAPLRERYVLRSREAGSDQIRIAPELRAKVTFGQINLMHAEYKPKALMDIVFLRNVLIYFEPHVQEQVVARLCRHVRPGGLLFLGHSDTVRSARLPLRLIRANIYQKRED